MRDTVLLPPFTLVVPMLGACLVGALLFPCKSIADGKPTNEQAIRPTTRQNDPRLPPVMPGEEIVTETGQRMRVWSSSGPVPVMQQPTPQQLPGGSVGAGGVGVIVDGRNQPDYHGDHAGPSRPGPRLPLPRR